MKALTEFLSQLEELDKNATVAPWVAGTYGVPNVVHNYFIEISDFSDQRLLKKEDAALIAQTRNALGTLLKIIRLQSEALESSCMCGEFGYILDPCPSCKAKAEIEKLLNEI